MVDLIDKESERLNQLASRLLQTARIDEAHLKLHSESFPMSWFLEDVLAEYRHQLRGHDVRVSVQPPDLSAYADRQTLASGVGQLIDNAAKYSHEGSPIVIFAQETLDEIVISVHNEGPTIPPLERERIFERFYRTEESKHRAAGTGLGLSIAKRTAEAHLGRVWVVSEENRGVTFFFALPRRRKKP
jgi:two-component system sensor histidine kinase KdpD